MSSNLPILLFMLPFTAALAVAVVGRFVRDAARYMTLVALAATAGLALVGLQRVLTEGTIRTHLGGWPPPIGIEVLLDPLSGFIAALVGAVALICVAGAVPHVRAELPGRKTLYYSCVLLVQSGLMGIIVTGDLFNLFVHIEMASLAAYALVAAGGRGAPRAALSYLVLGSVGAALYLIGVGFIFAGTGSLNMADVVTRLPAADPRLVVVGGVMVAGGLGVKMALFPLHVWMPAAYARSPLASASFMAPLVTKVSAYALLRVLFWVFGTGAPETDRILLELVAWAGAIGIVAAGVLAFVQQDLRRMLAYSSVSQVGIVALGLGLANPDALTGAVLHIASDALMKGLLFLAAGIALIRFGARNVHDLSRLRGQAPWTAAAIVVGGLSLIGIPPLAGFFGKWYVLSGAIAEQRWEFVVALVVGSIATIGYVFRIFERLFFASPREDFPAHEGMSVAVAACVVLALAIILLGVFNERVVSLLILPGLPAAP